MSDDTRLAFAHPSERAEASSDVLCDRISLRDYIVEVEIGAFQAERGHLQRVRFNVVVEVAPLTGPIDDDVDRILSYDRVTEAIGVELRAERINLLETLAARVAERILTEPQAVRVFVRIEKLDRGPFALGVEIVRARDGQTPVGTAVQEAPQPRVVYLSNATLADPGLSALLDGLLQDGVPMVLCGAPGEGPVRQTWHKMTRRRIGLLGIELNAWVLGARDLRWRVVATRSERDWAVENGQMCGWATS